MRTLNPQLLRANIESRINADMAAARVGCAAVCVMQGGKEIYKKYLNMFQLIKHQKFKWMLMVNQFWMLKVKLNQS